MNQEAQRENPSTGRSAFLWLVVGAVAVYLIPFIVVMIDERILKTFWLSHHSPAWLTDVMRAIYPFWKLFDR